MATELIERELEQTALSWPQKAKALAIRDQQGYDQGSTMLLAIKDLRKQIDDSYDPIISKAHAAHKAAVGAKKAIEEPLIQAETIIKRSLGDFIREQERIRQEAERKAREEAARIEEEMRLAAAVQAEEMDAPPEVVEEILQRPIPIPAPVIAPTFDKQAGITSKKVWRWELVDANKIPREFLTVDEIKINGIVRAMKGATNIPGIRVYEDTTIAAGRR